MASYVACSTKAKLPKELPSFVSCPYLLIKHINNVGSPSFTQFSGREDVRFNSLFSSLISSFSSVTN